MRVRVRVRVRVRPPPPPCSALRWWRGSHPAWSKVYEGQENDCRAECQPPGRKPVHSQQQLLPLTAASWRAPSASRGCLGHATQGVYNCDRSVLAQDDIAHRVAVVNRLVAYMRVLPQRSCCSRARHPGPRKDTPRGAERGPAARAAWPTASAGRVGWGKGLRANNGRKKQNE